MLAIFLYAQCYGKVLQTPAIIDTVGQDTNIMAVETSQQHPKVAIVLKKQESFFVSLPEYY